MALPEKFPLFFTNLPKEVSSSIEFISLESRALNNVSPVNFVWSNAFKIFFDPGTFTLAKIVLSCSIDLTLLDSISLTKSSPFAIFEDFNNSSTCAKVALLNL